MAKANRLTEKQCRELHNILLPGLEDTVKRTIKFAAEHSYSAAETMKFIGSFLHAFGENDMICHLLAKCTTDLLTGFDDGTNIRPIIDFPNSNKNSENKSSDTTKNTER